MPPPDPTPNNTRPAPNQPQPGNDAGSAAKPKWVGPPPKEVGTSFVKQYYTCMIQSPELMHRFYAQNAVMIHSPPDTDIKASIDDSMIEGMAAIKDKFDKAQVDGNIELTFIDCQRTSNNGTMLLVHGHITNREGRRKFCQSFVLEVVENNYFVRNDIFRYLDNGNGMQPALTPSSQTSLKPSKPADVAKSKVDADLNGTAALKAALKIPNEVAAEPSPSNDHSSSTNETARTPPDAPAQQPPTISPDPQEGTPAPESAPTAAGASAPRSTWAQRLGQQAVAAPVPAASGVQAPALSTTATPQATPAPAMGASGRPGDQPNGPGRGAPMAQAMPNGKQPQRHSSDPVIHPKQLYVQGLPADAGKEQYREQYKRKLTAVFGHIANVVDIIPIPNKSFVFVELDSEEAAKKVATMNELSYEGAKLQVRRRILNGAGRGSGRGRGRSYDMGPGASPRGGRGRGRGRGGMGGVRNHARPQAQGQK